MAKLRKTLFFLLKLGVAGGIIFWLFRGQSDKVLEDILHIGRGWLILAAVLYAVHLSFAALRWHLLLRTQNINITYFETFSLTMQGVFFGLVIPGGSVGGDMAKATFIATRTPPGAKFEGVLSIAMDRVFGMIGLFPLAAVSVLICHEVVFRMPPDAMVIVAVIFAGCVAGILFVLAIFLHRSLERFGPTRKLLALGDRLTHGSVSRISTALDFYKRSPSTLLWCLVISCVGIHLNLAVVYFFFSRGLGMVDMSFMDCILSCSLGNVAGITPGTFGGCGPREWVAKEMLRACGASSEKSLAIPAMYMSFVLLFNLSGGLFFVFDSMRRKIRGSTPPQA